jgi:hypothetical protein
MPLQNRSGLPLVEKKGIRPHAVQAAYMRRAYLANMRRIWCTTVKWCATSRPVGAMTVPVATATRTVSKEHALRTAAK